MELDEGPRERHNIVLSVDVMYLAGITFLVKVSHFFTFITVTYLHDRKKSTISKALKQVMGVYAGERHTVQEIEFTEWDNPIHTLLVDNEFRVLKDEFEKIGTDVNMMAREEHAPEVERQIRVIKGNS